MSQQETEWSPEIGYASVIQRGIKPILILASISSACSILASTFLLIISWLLFPIIIVCNVLIPLWHLVLLRQELTNPVRRRLSSSRKLIVRWLSRLCFSSLVVWVYTPSIAWVAIITCPLGFYGYTYFQSKYLRWQLDREEQQIPMHIVEKFGLYGFFAIVGISFLAMSFIMYNAGLGIEDIVNNFDTFVEMITNWHWLIQIGGGLLLCLAILTFFFLMMIEPISTMMLSVGVLFVIIFLIGLL